MIRSIGPTVSAALAATALSGCAVVSVQTVSKGDVEVTKGLGVVSIQVKPSTATVLVESTSFGAVRGFDGFALGYNRASLAAIAGDRCQLVLWVSTNEQLRELSALLRDRADICVVRPESSRGEKQ